MGRVERSVLFILSQRILQLKQYFDMLIKRTCQTSEYFSGRQHLVIVLKKEFCIVDHGTKHSHPKLTDQRGMTKFSLEIRVEFTTGFEVTPTPAFELAVKIHELNKERDGIRPTQPNFNHVWRPT